MPRKKETITLSIPPGTREQLEEIARRLNILWGKEPSISGLIVAIAQQQLEVGQPFSLNSDQAKALQQATKDLIDAGHVEEAKIVIALLLDRGTLEAPLRQSLLQQVSQPIRGWRLEIEDLRKKQQPFYLFYRNSQGQELEFTVRHAEIRFYEKRFYLQIWCEETKDVEADLPDLPELWHNRCLRLDRIKSIVPTSGDWRGKLDFIQVQLHFQGWLVNAYESKEDDLEDEKIDNVRQVVRRVVNLLWFIREVRRYGEDCIIMSPQSVRDRFKQEVRLLWQLYGMETGS